MADFNLGPLTANSSLKQPASTVTVTETQAGESGVSTQIFECSLDDAPTEGKFVLSESTNGDTAAITYNASAAAVETAIDAVVGYSVSGSAGGPWTCESDAQEAYSWSGAEDPSNPLRNGLGIEVATDQEGTNDWDGSGGVAFPVSALAGAGTMSSTGTGSVEFASALAGDGNTPYQGAGAVEFAVSGLAGDGVVPYSGTGDVTFIAALAGTGTISSTGTGDVTVTAALVCSGTQINSGNGSLTFAAVLSGQAEMADTGKGLKHYEHTGNAGIVLQL